MTSERKTMLILGAGYSGREIARLMAAKAWRVRGSSRSDAGVAALRQAGLEADIVNDNEFDPGLLDGVEALVVSIPPQDSGDPVAERLAAFGRDRLRHLRWIGYLSTTGVYGDTGGAWVDETAPTNPSNARGRRRVVAEGQWLELGRRLGIATQIFRLPGIYGPGRSALDDVRSGRARRIDRPGHAFSRVHVADIAQAVVASVAQPQADAIYNVCDDLPAPSAEVVAYACELLGVEPPPLLPYQEIEPTLSPMSREFFSDNRRIRNDRLKNDLGVRLAYPDYRAGLQAIFKQES